MSDFETLVLHDGDRASFTVRADYNTPIGTTFHFTMIAPDPDGDEVVLTSAVAAGVAENLGRFLLKRNVGAHDFIPEVDTENFTGMFIPRCKLCQKFEEEH